MTSENDNNKNSRYVSSKEKWQDHRSTASSFIGLGTLGIVVVALHILGVFSLPFWGKGLNFSTGMTGAIFLIFIGIGFYSLKESRRLSANIDSEENFHQELLDWFFAAYTAADLQGQENDSEEALFYDRSEQIKSLILQKYPKTDPAFLESVSEEIYAHYFD